MPITWKNIAGPNFESGNDLMQSGVESMTGGLDALAKAAQTYGTQQQDERIAIRDDNTQQFLDQIDQMKNMDNYKNQAGQFSQSALSGQNVDASKIMGAYGQQKTDIRNLIKSDNAFDTSEQANSERLIGINEKPILTEYNTMVANGDHESAQVFYETNKDKVRDWSAALDSGEKAKRDDKEYNDAALLETQTVDAGNFYTDILHAPGTNEGNIVNTLQKKFDDAGIPQGVVQSFLDQARDQYKEGVALTDVDNQKIASLGAGFDQKIADINALYAGQVADSSTRLTNDEFENYKRDSDTYNNQSQAIDYIGARSGESSMLTWDSYTPNFWVTRGVQGAENAAEATLIMVGNVQKDLEENGSSTQKDLLAQTGGQIPGFVIKRAFDRVGKAEDGEWNVNEFHRGLKQEWLNYTNQYGAIQIREKLDQDHKMALDSLNKTKLQGVSALSSQLRNKQKNAFSNSN